jgi:hypothetical protein
MLICLRIPNGTDILAIDNDRVADVPENTAVQNVLS